jgi:hypothetical protein
MRAPNCKATDYRDPAYDEYEGTCPICEGDTNNYTSDADEDGIRFTDAACDSCAAECTSCGERNTMKLEDSEICVKCHRATW